METKTRTKEEIANDIKAKIEEINYLLNEASHSKLKVDFKQAFHPMMNTNGAPFNAPLSASIFYQTHF